MDDLTKLPNIGPVLAGKLNQTGVMTLSQLAEIGCIQATIRIGDTDMSACFNMLYALEGAIRDVRWHTITKEDREKIKAEFKKAISE
jgi:DNA transformation protein